MPPELIVTSSQSQEISDRFSKSSNIGKGAQKGHLNVKKSLSRRGSCQKQSPGRIKQLRQSGDMSDPEGKAPTEINLPFKQQFWRVLSSDNLPWTYANALSHEQLLKACSLKLAELKKKHKSKKEKLELAGLPLRQPSIKHKVKQRRTKSMRYEYERPGNYRLDNNDALKIKPFRTGDQKKTVAESPIKNAKKTPNKKFRKGGIVSLATVNNNAVRNEILSGDESLENSAGNKKKKKKRKILQLQKHMKSAVTAVALSKKESNKNISKKKN